MKPRVLIALVALLVFVLGGFIYLVFRSDEPRHDGHSLSHWLRELETAPVSSERWQIAARAVENIGTNALPALLTMLQTPDSKWKMEAVDWLHENAEVDLSETLGSIRGRRAMLGFRQLRTMALPALPALTELALNPDPRVSLPAVGALSEINRPEVVPALVAVLASPNPALRAPTATSLGGLRAHGEKAVPALVAALGEDDYVLRLNAARALGEIALDADRAVPALTRALRDTNTAVVATAAMALGYFGSRAESAAAPMRELAARPDDFSTRMIPRALVRIQCEVRDGAIVRGPVDRKRIAFLFTAHEFAEGATNILDALKQHDSRAAFFLTGVFLANTNFAPLVDRLKAEGHFIGPHSDRHLLYCSWDDRRTLVSEPEFIADLARNAEKLFDGTGTERRFMRYFLPPFEHYNREIADWTRKQRWTLINFTPGTRSNADYTGEADKNFVSSQAIFDSILKREREGPNGLNGFLLLLHLGSGPGRADKFHARFGELLDHLADQGYEFVRLDELLGPGRASR